MNDFIKTTAAAGILGTLLAGCAGKPVGSDRSGVVMARGYESVIAGGHCESSAMTNALRALGYGLEEYDVAGGGAAPSFMFATEGFPFVGTRSYAMRETFLNAARIPYAVRVPDRGADPWAEILALLDEGIPVPLRVDMRYLPYLYGGKYGPPHMSFGWHWVCLFGVDYDRGIAFVTDTALPGLKEIALRDLSKARASTTKVWPPNNEWLALRPAPPEWRLDVPSIAAASLRAMADNYAGKDRWSSGDQKAGARAVPTGLAGLEAFPALIRDFDDYIKPYLVPPALRYLGDCIEKNGTGGAGFRVLFRDFIAASARKPALIDAFGTGAAAALNDLQSAADEAIAAWRALARAFTEEGDGLKAGSKKEARDEAYGRLALRAQDLAAAERRVRDAVEAAISALN